MSQVNESVNSSENGSTMTTGSERPVPFANLNHSGLESQASTSSIRQTIQNPYAFKRTRLAKKNKHEEKDENEDDHAFDWDALDSPIVKPLSKRCKQSEEESERERKEPSDMDTNASSNAVSTRDPAVDRLRLPSRSLSIQSCPVLTFSEALSASTGSFLRVTAQVAAISGGGNYNDDNNSISTLLCLTLTDPMNPAPGPQQTHSAVVQPHLEQQQIENTISGTATNKTTTTATTTTKSNTTGRRRSFTITPNPLLSKSARCKAGVPTSTATTPNVASITRPTPALPRQKESPSQSLTSPFLLVQVDSSKTAVKTTPIEVGDLITVWGHVTAQQTIEADIVHPSNGTNVALQLKALQARRKYLSQLHRLPPLMSEE